jgi:chemotaxis methyl-accepting protein methylase
MTPSEDAAFASLARQISQGAGVALDAYKDKCIRRRIAVRMRACGVHTYADYQALLTRTPIEYQRLRDVLTINDTRFYRNPDTWKLLRQELIPSLCAQVTGAIRIWSAGCASGEEAYTTAVLFAEHFDRIGQPERLESVTVDATDIDRECLERARSAQYRREALTDMPAELVQGYFQQAGLEYRVQPRVQRRVLVEQLDLNRDAPIRSDYHLLLCRNVVIYFDRPMQERLFLLFSQALAPGGYLVLGKVETLFGVARERLTLLDPRERVYRRPR